MEPEMEEVKKTTLKTEQHKSTTYLKFNGQHTFTGRPF